MRKKKKRSRLQKRKEIDEFRGDILSLQKFA